MEAEKLRLEQATKDFDQQNQLMADGQSQPIQQMQQTGHIIMQQHQQQPQQHVMQGQVIGTPQQTFFLQTPQQQFVLSPSQQQQQQTSRQQQQQAPQQQYTHQSQPSQQPIGGAQI